MSEFDIWVVGSVKIVKPSRKNRILTVLRRNFFCVSFTCFYAFVRVCLLMPCCHLLWKGWPLGSRVWCLIVKLSLFHWYPGSGVVLDCIYSWSLPSFLHSLLINQLDEISEEQLSVYGCRGGHICPLMDVALYIIHVWQIVSPVAPNRIIQTVTRKYFKYEGWS